MRAIVHILIIDDHAGVRTLIRELLAETFEVPGRRVTFSECPSGERALEAIQTQRPDLVTVDLRMQGMNGLECVRHLRATLPLACIVVVTQFGNEALRDRARFAGADSVVLKDDLNQLPLVTRDYLKHEVR
jgi:DNA-binding NarL/FixJ family response regulator